MADNLNKPNADVDPDDAWLTIMLKRPIKAHGGDRHELVLREPIAQDLIDCGMPLAFSGDAAGGAAGALDMKAVSKMLARLANVPVTSIGRMHPGDFVDATNKIIAFLFPGQEADKP